MHAMVLEAPGKSLISRELPVPEPAKNQVQIRVSACAVCRTDLHVIDGELSHAKLPLIPGHEIVGYVTKIGSDVSQFRKGDRVGVPWLGWTCGKCPYCLSGRENLCDKARFTGYTLDGGYSEYTLADVRFCFALPENCEDEKCAPLLCAGLIGYRSLRKAGDALKIGLYGFGAAAHIVAQIAHFEGRQIFAFTRQNDATVQHFAKKLGAVWVGSSLEAPPEQLDAAIIFAPVGGLVPMALRAIRKGGVVVCGGIHMSDIPSFPYRDLWGERSLCSVANLTRRDGNEFLEIASRIPIRTETKSFPLEQANEALSLLRSGQLTGAAVLLPSHISLNHP